MEELKHRLGFLFSLVGLLVCLGKFDDRSIETYVLTDTGLILKQDAVHIYPDVNYAQEILEQDSDELTPAPAEDKEEQNRAPSSADLAFRIYKLGTKRKTKTMIASNEAPAPVTDAQVERSRSVEIDSAAISSALEGLPQDNEALAQMQEQERALSLDLFDDVSLDAVVNSIKPTPAGGFQATGYVAGLTGSTFQLVHENGKMTANIYTATTQFEVRSNGGKHIVNQINPTKIPTMLASAPQPEARLPLAAATAAPEMKYTAASKAQNPACSIRIESPAGKEVLSQSLGEKVLWSSSGAGHSVRISLLKGDQDLGLLARAANDGSTLIRIPALVDPDSDYKIRIESVDDPSCFAESPEAFSIVP